MSADGARPRSWWGWGWEDAVVAGAELEALRAMVAGLSGSTPELHDPPPPAALALRPSRLAPPAALAAICVSDPLSRAAHTHGKAFRDVARNLLGRLDHPPDVVAHPRSEADVVALLDWCSSAGLAAIPYGGGSSVVGGIEADVGDAYPGTIAIDLGLMDQVLAFDATSHAALVQAGALGPALEAQLRPHGYSLRHFPQSFEFSSLGGWLATRAGGPFATLYTHIDDLTESIRAVTPAGVMESRRLPASGAGPSPDRLLLGSEGTLGIITEAWVRLVPRPRWRGRTSVRFHSFEAGVGAARALAQSRLYPANCRLLDGTEAALSAATPGVGSLLLVAFESADHPVDAWLARAEAICRDHGGDPGAARLHEEGDGIEQGSADGAGSWRATFLRAPYLRDALVRLGMVVETFETACTWDRFAALHSAVMDAARDAAERVCGPAIISCRFTHVYPDGPAPYFSVIAPGRWGDQVQQWDEVKAAVSEALTAAGGTITHHHAVGRVHRPWYDRERPDMFAAALRAAKGVLDPAGILNPGVLVDPVTTTA
ncbi:MAG: FAD-binding oxidoreductase [Candidatus Dormibacteria bacterium]